MQYDNTQQDCHFRQSLVCIQLCSYDLDLDPVTFIVDRPRYYEVVPATKNAVSRSRHSKVRDRQTDTQTDMTENTTTLHLQVIIKRTVAILKAVNARKSTRRTMHQLE